LLVCKQGHRRAVRHLSTDTSAREEIEVSDCVALRQGRSGVGTLRKAASLLAHSRTLFIPATKSQPLQKSLQKSVAYHPAFRTVLRFSPFQYRVLKYQQPGTPNA
jgi:hypothetical protein